MTGRTSISPYFFQSGAWGATALGSFANAVASEEDSPPILDC
ncbi:hypothetical protein RintRC_4131 [Richelia intracellularis]|nr:hypothetical protein RintRC_4131 [Richelia intracellularis]